MVLSDPMPSGMLSSWMTQHHGNKDDRRLERVFRSMGEPSWWVLSALAANPEGLAPFQIVRHVQHVLRTADHPIKRLDPGTLHYALPRLEELGVIEAAGEREM